MNVYLQTAIMNLKRGYPLPVDLAMKLQALGYDVPALEARYSL